MILHSDYSSLPAGIKGYYLMLIRMKVYASTNFIVWFYLELFKRDVRHHQEAKERAMTAEMLAIKTNV